MLRLSKKMFYAVEAVLFLAHQTTTDPVSGKDIARRQGLPSRYLEQIMQQLVRAGILRGVRGPKGGYLLARERRRITLAEICKVVREMEPLEEDPFTRTPFSRELVYPLCLELQDELEGTLGDIHLGLLCKEAESKGIARQNESHSDYTI